MGSTMSDHSDHPGFVYFFLSEGLSAVKIGHSKSVGRRFSQLQTGHPSRLFYVGCLVGDKRMEAAIHSRFDFQRLEGEWFTYNEEIVEFCKEITSHRGPDYYGFVSKFVIDEVPHEAFIELLHASRMRVTMHAMDGSVPSWIRVANIKHWNMVHPKANPISVRLIFVEPAAA